MNAAPEPTDVRPIQRLKQTLRELGPAAPLAIAVSVLPPLGSLALVSIATTTNLGPWLRDHASVGLPLYVASFWLLGICLLPTYAYSMLGGYAFGFVGGSIAAVLAYVGACAAAFAIARHFARDRVIPLIERHPHLAAVRHVLADASLKRSTVLIALLRISPAAPFAISNMVLGATGVRWPAFAIGTLVGVVPRTIAVVWIAARAGELSFKTGEGWTLFAVGVVATIVAAGVIAWVADRELKRMIAAGQVKPPEPASSSHPT